MQTAFFLEDEFRGNINSSSLYDSLPNTNNSTLNVSDSRPKVAWRAGKSAPLATETSFEVDNDNRYIDIEDSGANTETLSIPRGSYTGPNFVIAINAQFAASTHAPEWIADYNPVSGIFSFLDASISPTNNIKLLWKTGPNGSDNTDKSLAREIGFVNPGGDAADTALGITQQASYGRWNTHTFIRFKLDTSESLRAWICEIDNQSLGSKDETIDDANINIFGNNSNLGQLFNWQDSASVDLEYSPGGIFSENQIRLAYVAGGDSANYTNWLFSWRHQDSHKIHTVKLCKAFLRTWSSTGRTLSTLSRAGLNDSSASLGVDNYYPAPRLKNWVAPLSFDSWPAAEYRTVVQGVVHHGRQNGFVWALRWDDIVAGTVNAEDEADKGFLLWGALQDYSLDTYVGESADYMSGEIVVEQIR
tara:strand:- start:4144 stop:5397 length:1254 start_codon:yes stop_codon:yes gene_type:complete